MVRLPVIVDPVPEDHPLAGAFLKWKRAHFHFRALNEMVEGLYPRGSYDLYAEVDAQGRPTIRVRNVRQPSLKVGVVVGDIVHNARSCLDHLVYELSRPLDGGEPPGGTEFPIFLNGREFKAKGRSGGRFKIRAVRRGAKGVVERFQPYHRRKDPDLFLLWQLHELSKIDKHRVVHVVTSSAEVTDVHFDPRHSNLQVRDVKTYSGGPLEEHSKVARFDIGRPEHTEWRGPIEAELQANIRLDIAFDKRSPAKSVAGESVRHTLARTLDLISHRVIPELRPFLE
jgi:hypothetical protein